jgi:hypothetical protein
MFIPSLSLPSFFAITHIAFIVGLFIQTATALLQHEVAMSRPYGMYESEYQNKAKNCTTTHVKTSSAEVVVNAHTSVATIERR